jgi:hypothetical protein
MKERKESFGEWEAYVSVLRARSSLMSECAKILARCERLPNSLVVMVAEEMVDSVSRQIDFGTELMFLTQRTIEIAGGAEDSGRDAHNTERQLLDIAAYLYDLTFRWNDSERFLIGLIWNLID